jgi:ankyrin repeat protein
MATAEVTSTMDNGTRIAPEVEAFLRLARAGDVDACRSLLQANKALVNSIEAGGYAALHFAAFRGQIALIQVLHEFGCDLNPVNYDGNTPLMLAAKMGQNDAISLMVRLGADVNFKGHKHSTAAHQAVLMGHMHTLHLLKDLGAQLVTEQPTEQGTLLHWAAQNGEVNIAGELIYDFGLPIDAVDAHGGTPLFMAIFAKKSELVQFLLEHGANPNHKCGEDTPLIVAVEHGSLDDVKNLIAFGADLTPKDSEGRTALDIATSMNRPESVRELTRARPDAAKRAEDALRFKNHGNRVFGDGENIKAAKFYTQAITLDPKNQVYFSNRSACHFNTKQYLAALWDAERCVRLAPQWVRGYVRKAATLRALFKKAEARAVCEKGLELEAGNKDLLAILEEVK